MAQVAAGTLESQLRGLATLPEGEEHRAVLNRQRDLRLSEAQAQRDEQQRLVLQAPFDGVLTDLDPEIALGSWIDTRHALAVLHAPAPWQAEILVAQEHRERFEPGATVHFYPEGQRLSPLKGRVVGVDRFRTAQLDYPLLSSQHEGNIPVLPDKHGLTPRDVLYKVRVALDDPPAQSHILRGDAVIDGHPHSWLVDAVKPALILVIRELGF